VRVFLGITGASGAPYAARLVEALTSADVELGICASSAGIEVLATEL
jgi:4-hydroxy-3-polyprenylbenzoate decarboxylase